ALSVPWIQGGVGFDASLSSTSLGPLTGIGYVSPAGDAFAYVYKENNSPNAKLGFFGGTPTPNDQFKSTGFGSYVLRNLSPDGLSTMPFAPDDVTKASAFAASTATVSSSPLY